MEAMAYMTLRAQPVAMATTQLLQATCQEVEIRWPVMWREKKQLGMRWVVAIDEKGTRRLRMVWQASGRETA